MNRYRDKVSDVRDGELKLSRKKSENFMTFLIYPFSYRYLTIDTQKSKSIPTCWSGEEFISSTAAAKKRRENVSGNESWLRFFRVGMGGDFWRMIQFKYFYCLSHLCSCSTHVNDSWIFWWRFEHEIFSRFIFLLSLFHSNFLQSFDRIFCRLAHA